ncbi:hypothetical protein EDC04DRAFT_2905784 [Pisolithus marmoratus]|nr:hypothetical protein EDC04DRAFT_2905784 [Pisolithus marmoratus]
MARTKQTARKVTGGKAPRVKLQSLQKKKSKTALSLKQPTFKRKTMANSFCVMCRNGGDLWICDEKDCKRVVCHKCLIVPEKSLKDVTEDHSNVIHFFIISDISSRVSTPKANLSSLNLLSSQVVFQHAINAQVAPHSTALIHLHLENLEVGHAQVNMIHSLLQPYFPKGRYQFSQLPFNLTTQESLVAYQSAAFNLATSLSSCQSVTLFLTTHSDEEKGDLFAGFVDGVIVASEVSEVLHALFTPFTQIIRVAHIFFNVCGSVVTVKDSFNGLKKAAQLFRPKSMVLFDAQHLHLATTIPYLLSLVDSTIIQGFDVSSAIKFALNDCAMLGRHFNIIVMMWRSQGENMEAMGELLASPMSSVWKLPEVEKGPKNTSIPPQQYTLSIPEGAIQLPHGKKGTSSWLQFTL